MLANNNNYTEVFQFENWKFYQPVNIADGYHHSRYLAAVHNEIYANSGATKDVLKIVMDEIVLRCNKEYNHDNLRTDIAGLANSILYRLKFPVDEHCAIRQGAILLIAEKNVNGQIVTENPDKVEHDWIEQKVNLALQVPDVYAFFLTTGVLSLPQYKDVWNTLNITDYFHERRQAIAMLMPQKR